MWKLQDLQIYVRFRIQPVYEDQVRYHLKLAKPKKKTMPGATEFFGICSP